MCARTETGGALFTREGVKIPGGGGGKTVEPTPGRWAARGRGNPVESGRRNLDRTVPGCASNLDRCIAQACNCDRRGRIRVSEVKPVPAPEVGRWLKLETFIEVREVLWNLGPLKTPWVRQNMPLYEREALASGSTP